MLDRDRLARDAENFRYGFLSAAVEPVLSRPIGERLDAEELRQLDLARSFLSDVVDGARLIAKGEASSVSASRAVDALGYALGPLEAMQQLHLETMQQLDLNSEDQVLAVFREMLECIKVSISAKRLAGSESSLNRTAQLFRFLNESGLSSVKHRSQLSTRNPAVTLQ